MFNLETQIKKKLAEMDLRIKNLKSKKKKKADKKTFDISDKDNNGDVEMQEEHEKHGAVSGQALN